MIRGHTRLAFSLTRYGSGSDQGTISTARGTWASCWCFFIHLVLKNLSETPLTRLGSTMETLKTRWFVVWRDQFLTQTLILGLG
ncbi:hypothetical protein Bca101_096528 [Brassica carinata]